MERRATKTPKRFGFERRTHAYVLPQGTFESALLVLKEVFGDQTHGVSDTSFWIQYEDKATMQPNEACFQYFLAGVGHKVLAQRLLNNFGNYRSSVLTGVIPKEQNEQYRQTLSNKLYDLYPPKYRGSVEK